MRLHSLAVAAFLTSWPFAAAAQLYINEFMASNDTTIEDPDEPGAFEDWIELYNGGPTLVDLGGMYLTDDLGQPTRWQFETGMAIEADAFLLIWADDDGTQGNTHTNFKLGASGEAIGLFDVDGITVIDSVTFGQQITDISEGRYPDGDAIWRSMPDPTPGSNNQIPAATAARISVPGGTFTGSLLVSLEHDNPAASIYYTLDGSEPSEGNGFLYTAEIDLSITTWLRARAYEPGFSPSLVVSEVYMAIAAEIQDFDSNLPIVILDTFGRDIDLETDPPRPFRPVSAVFVDTDTVNARAAILDAPNYAGHAGMHVRGETSMNYPKKQYAFEAWNEDDQDKDVAILGMPPEADWILHAPYSDKTLMRNYLMYRWSNEIGQYATRCRFVEMFTDKAGDGVVQAGDYVGVYVVMEKIERGNDRVDIRKLQPYHDTEPEITGGYMMQKDRWYDFPQTNWWVTNHFYDVLLYEEPEADEITTAQRLWIKDHVNDAELVLATPCPDPSPCAEHPVTGYVDFFDAESFIDHHLLVEMARNVDGFILSTYVHKDREDKLKMGPIWDYNGSLGNGNYYCAWETEGWHHEYDEALCGGGDHTFPTGNSTAYTWYEHLWKDPDHKLQYADRWFALREDLLSTARLQQTIDEVAALITDGGAPDNAVERNFARWDVLYEYVWPNYFCCGSYAEHVDWMKDWLAARLDWMDTEISRHYRGGCRIQVTPSGQPLTIDRGQTLSFTATVHNPCFQSRNFDRALLHVGAPGNLDVVLYDGGAVNVASGDSLSAIVELDVPMRAPTTEYVVDVGLYSNDVLQNLGGFAITVTPAPLRRQPSAEAQ